MTTNLDKSEKYDKYEYRKRKNAAKKRRSQYRQWHKRLGIIIAVIISLVSLTGIGLNHTGSLNLGQSYVSSGWILDHYQVKPPTHVQKFDASQLELVVMDNQVWLKDVFIGHYPQQVLLAHSLGQDSIIVVTANSIEYYDARGQLFDSLEVGFSLEAPIIRASVNDNQLSFDDEYGHWQLVDGFIEAAQDKLQPGNVIELKGEAIAPYVDRYRSRFITHERLLQDIHSGRFFGPLGVWLVDLSALGLIFLAFSGLYLSRQKKY
ncbi:PepSY-associated TM helix domain-containing protein [Paraferrimonas sp. SM1919]|uniref:PepSY-associated TM helix domain-containing protein n=1 Tax=Paraferrimonas sp. SM1919 TaxID=2662263 RepID=UPI0013D1FF63|nr:PepSY-associated TM helix domain-containing protein [Paraferrimonas sp. SM1919]